jgi:hypothetical protein
MFGNYERFNDFEYESASNVDFICFTDDAQLNSKRWQMILTPPSLLDPARTTRRYKAQPHRFLPDYDWSLYIDNSVRLKVSPQQIFDQYLADAKSPHVCFRHYERDCIYDEAAKVIELGLDDPARVEAQMAHYRRLGYPEKNGLAKNAFILRRHHDTRLLPSMEHWFNQVLCYSTRDQLSLNPVLWFYNFELNYLPLKFSDFELLEWPFADNVRLPKDFVDADYVKYYPQAAENPRRHYLYEWAPHNLAQATGSHGHRLG